MRTGIVTYYIAVLLCSDASVASPVDQCAARMSVDMDAGARYDCSERSSGYSPTLRRHPGPSPRDLCLIRVVGIQTVPGRSFRTRTCSALQVFRPYTRCVRLLLKSDGPARWDPCGAFVCPHQRVGWLASPPSLLCHHSFRLLPVRRLLMPSMPSDPPGYALRDHGTAFHIPRCISGC